VVVLQQAHAGATPLSVTAQLVHTSSTPIIQLPQHKHKTTQNNTARRRERKKLPFFLYSYADNEIIVARGRSGGLAAWVKTTPAWEMESGVAQVYK